MKILIDMQGAQNENRFRGIGRYAIDLVRAILSSNTQHEIFILYNVAFPEGGEHLKSTLSGLIPFCHWIPFDVSRSSDNFSREGRACKSANAVLWRSVISAVKPDFVLITSHINSPAENTVTDIPSEKNGIRYGVVFYDLIPLKDPAYYLPNDELNVWYYQKITQLKNADVVFTLSNHVKNDLVSRLGLGAEKIHTIYGGYDNRIFKYCSGMETAYQLIQKLGVSSKYLLYTGGADKRKNLHGLLQAYSLLPSVLIDQYQLVVVGKIGTNEREMLTAEAKVLKLPERSLVFLGYVEDEVLALLYSACALFVFPSFEEGFGLPVLEAMACGAPVIASNASCLPEVMGPYAAMFPPQSTHALRDLIEAALSDEVLLGSILNNGANRIVRFSWQRTAQLFWNGLTGLIDASTDAVGTTEQQVKKHAILFGVNIAESITPHIKQLLDRNYRLEERLEIGTTSICDRTFLVWSKEARLSDLLSSLVRSSGIVLVPNRDLLNGLAELFSENASLFANLFDSEMLFLFRAYSRQRGRRGDQNILALILDFMTENGSGIIFLGPTSFNQALASLGVAGKEKIGTGILPLWDGALTSVGDAPDLDSVLSDSLFEFVERGYVSSPTALRSRLIKELAAEVRDFSPHPEKILKQLSRAISFNTRNQKCIPNLYVDISELSLRDARSGIQRVVRSVVKEWITEPPSDFRIVPVRFEKGRYYYATEYVVRNIWKEASEEVRSDGAELVVSPGDVFLGLDLTAHLVWESIHHLKAFRAAGCQIYFVIYDILPLMMSQYFPDGTYPAFKYWLEQIAFHSDGLIAISKTVMLEVQRWLRKNLKHENLNRLKYGYFHLGSDIEASIPTRSTALSTGLPSKMFDFPLFLMVGTLEPRKGYDQALAAFELLWRKGLKINLCIVGREGWKVDEMVRALKTSRHLGEHLFWLNHVADDELILLYQKSSALIAASRGEGFGLPIIEAAQRGIPVIARDLPVFREVAGDGASFFLGDSAEALAGAVESWLASDARDHRPRLDGATWQTWKESSNSLLNLVRHFGQQPDLSAAKPGARALDDISF